MIPTISIIRQKDSLKTNFTGDLIAELQNRGLNVMLIKLAHKKGAEFSLKELSKCAKKVADLILLENFSGQILEDLSVAKVLIVKDKLEYEESMRKHIEPLLCICSYSPLEAFNENMNVLNIKRDLYTITDRVINFVNNEMETINILDKLAGLDCGKCGYNSCLSLARAVKEGKASIEKCVPIRLKNELKCKIIVNDKEVHIQPFVSEIIRKSVLGMISTLKGVEIDGNEAIEVRTHQ